jgi:2-keto-3-deoxy-6-phosphogluconate aldolase
MHVAAIMLTSADGDEAAAAGASVLVTPHQEEP